MHHTRNISAVLIAGAATWLGLQFGLTSPAFAGADPAFDLYGYQQIVATPSPAIVDETTDITVMVSNLGDAPATNVVVKLSFNDWGVTFQGWQEIGTVTIPTVNPGVNTASADFGYVFENRAHTCLEALIVSADENTNLNNDRGQINLEVVNAGENFDYGVPIVNNGDEDIMVDIRLLPGECVLRQDPAVGVDRQCEPIGNPIREIVPAGEEIVVPVHVDFAGMPPGTAVEIVVEARDVLSGETNHVVVHAVYNPPRALVERCLAALAGLPDLPSPDKGKGKSKGKSKGKGNKLDEIASHIDKALSDDAWVDDSHLQPNPHDVNLVYGQIAVAVEQLVQLTESKHLTKQWKMPLDRCARELTDATRILLQTAIGAGNPEAEALLAEGDRLRLAGQEKKAVRHYVRGHVTVLK